MKTRTKQRTAHLIRRAAILSAAVAVVGIVAASARADLLGWFRQPRASYGAPAYVAPPPAVAAPAMAAPGYSSCNSNTSYYQPSTSYYQPSTTGYRPWWRTGPVNRPPMVRGMTVARPVVATAPVTAYSPAGACDVCTPQVSQNVVVNYPQPAAYQTRWVQIPVTNFRPVTTLDPVTGAPVTSMQPCTTYQWQARRTPVRSFRPSLLNRLLHPFAPRGPQVVGQVNTVQCAPAIVESSPYYSQPYNSTPYGAAPYSSAPAASGTTILSPSPSTAPMGGQGAEPADTAPSLEPGAAAGAAGGYGYNLRKIETPLSQTGTALDATQPTETAPRGFTIPPVQDPDAKPSSEKTQAPPLLQPANKQDRVARRDDALAWAYTPVSWPDEQPAASETTPEAQPSRPARWDDSGWRSVRP